MEGVGLAQAQGAMSREGRVTWRELKPVYMREEWETRLARQTGTRLWKVSYTTLSKYLDFVGSQEPAKHFHVFRCVN